ncbi:hypothetical protein SOM61_22070 [Massilia sp. CFBP9012]|uniref:hypothetical protein n=1 Tax=Massilia sp. CFBP9012 TaxID=3096531 RepID=UPI002A699700|nr:hypothetical protein [Massilia sp. CFBP9012]MDY0977657.1 hypothetical protein [Massilia sp. CFBP9012]
MRPSDENQDNRMHAHMRPNLMSSSRRGGREDSILAKLEREPARRAGTGNGGRLAWYGAAVTVAVGLTATLAWLAAGAGPAPLEVARPEAAPAPIAEMAPAPVETAVIVDAAPAPEPVLAAAPAPVPPLRLLEPATVPAAPPKAAPAPVKAAPLPRRPEARAAAPTRPRAQASRQATRPVRTVNPARTGESQDDSDVALISAVIYHANGHAAPTEDEAPAPPAR